jgi:hypothetical protein
LAKVLSPGQPQSYSLTPEQLDSASAFALSTLQPCRRGFIGKPIAPLVTAGAKEFAPNRVIELAEFDPKRGNTLKKITTTALLLVGLCVAGSPRAVAQDTSSQSSVADSTAHAMTDQQLALLRRDIRSIKKQLVAANLTLTDSEATKFWQVYKQYAAETGKINETRAAIIEEYSDEYGTLTDDQADNLIRRWLDTDIELAKLRQRYVPVFRKVLPGKKAATFFQLDRRISMMIDVQLTSQLPLVQSQD